MRILFLSTFLFTASLLQAQQTEVYKIKPGEYISDVIKHEQVYSFPAFKQGTITFKGGEKAGAKMNYNALIGEMEFVNPGSNDTLTLDNAKTIKHIYFAADTFYYQDGYLKQLASGGEFKLASRQLIKLSNQQQAGAFDQAMPSGARSFSSPNSNLAMYNLPVREALTLVKETDLFIGDKFNAFTPFTKKNVLKLFSKHEKEINNYLNTSSVNFKKQEDLVRLFHYLKTL